MATLLENYRTFGRQLNCTGDIHHHPGTVQYVSRQTKSRLFGTHNGDFARIYASTSYFSQHNAYTNTLEANGDGYANFPPNHNATTVRSI
jgi:hypothetical protein